MLDARLGRLSELLPRPQRPQCMNELDLLVEPNVTSGGSWPGLELRESHRNNTVCISKRKGVVHIVYKMRPAPVEGRYSMNTMSTFFQG